MNNNNNVMSSEKNVSQSDLSDDEDGDLTANIPLPALQVKQNLCLILILHI